MYIIKFQSNPNQLSVKRIIALTKTHVQCFCHEASPYGIQKRTVSDFFAEKHLFSVRLQKLLTDPMWFIIIKGPLVLAVRVFWIRCGPMSTCFTIFVKFPSIMRGLFMSSNHHRFLTYQSMMS